MNDTSAELERKALLAASGEARLNPQERELTAAWRHDLDRLSRAAGALAAAAAPRGTSLNDQHPAIRGAITRQRLRFRRVRILRRVAAAAMVTLLLAGSLRLQQAQAERARLDRLGSVLFLLNDAEAAIDDERLAAAGARISLESLSTQLSLLQGGNTL
jgi:hypothetical protein